MSRPLGGQVKVSLHESGNWRHAFLDDQKASEYLLDGADRAFDRFGAWAEPIAPGWTLAYAVCLPESELRHYPSESKPALEIPVAGTGHAVLITIYLVEPGAPPLPWEEQCTYIGGLTLASGTRVAVLSEPMPISPTLQQSMDEAKVEARQQAVERKDDLRDVSPVIALIMAGENGGRYAVEICAWDLAHESTPPT